MIMVQSGLAATHGGIDGDAQGSGEQAAYPARDGDGAPSASGSEDRHYGAEIHPQSVNDAAIAPGQVRSRVSASADYAFSRRIVCLSDPTGAAAASYRALQTHLLARHVGEGRRGLVVYAPHAGTGCTTVAVNVAVACAQAGTNTLLVDANLSQPAVHDFIRPPDGTGGLVHMLSAKTEDQMDEIRRQIRPNLSVLFAGGVAAQGHDLVAQRRFKHVLDDCMRSFDLTIVDVPASSSDARQIAMTVRHAMLVTRRHVTLLADVKRALAELASDRVKVAGTFLTDF